MGFWNGWALLKGTRVCLHLRWAETLALQSPGIAERVSTPRRLWRLFAWGHNLAKPASLPSGLFVW